MSDSSTWQNGTSSSTISGMENTTTAAEPTVHVIVLAKYSNRHLTDDVRENHLSTILATVNNKRNATLGWRMERRAFNARPMFKEVSLGGRELRNEAYFNVWMDREVSSLELDGIVRNFDQADAVNSKNRWFVHMVDGDEYQGQTRDADEEQTSGKSDLKDLVPYADCSIPDNWEDFFYGKDPIFGLDSHISRMMRPLRVAIGTDFEVRHNTLLVGPPACGKSEIMGRLVRMVGQDAVMQIDATSTTAKGFQQMLAERSVMPRVLLVEEIEKGSQELHEVLLSVMDTRGEVRKMTARGRIMMEAKMVAIVTANDYEKFQRSAAGAIESRTANKINFERAERPVLVKILEKHIRKIGANPKIVDRVLDYAEAHGIWDTRELIALAQCGGDDWLDDTYAKELAATAPKNRAV